MGAGLRKAEWSLYAHSHCRDSSVSRRGGGNQQITGSGGADTVILWPGHAGRGDRYDVVVTGSRSSAWWLLAGPVDSSVPGITVPVLYEGASASVQPPFVWPTSAHRRCLFGYDGLRPLDANLGGPFADARAIPMLSTAARTGEGRPSTVRPCRQCSKETGSSPTISCGRRPRTTSVRFMPQGVSQTRGALTCATATVG